MKILITGAAGFIGFHLSKLLLGKGFEVVGVDALSGYYSTQLKQDRLAQLKPFQNFSFSGIDICKRSDIEALFASGNFEMVIHLAAQPGVRYSVDAPHKYVESNLLGFMNVLEATRQNHIRHFVFASSSSVYGNRTDGPFSEDTNTDHPESLYAATKKSNELIAYSYSRQFGIQAIGLRFFSVYGPWGRPDMAYFSFTKKILNGEAIPVFNNGEMIRDFTYVDDICDGVLKMIQNIKELPRYKIYNLGNNRPVTITAFIEAIEEALGRKSLVDLKPMQAGDVVFTCADITEAQRDFGFNPQTSLNDGLKNFVAWFHNYYRTTNT
jgi:UDP-glucuronate 4-epimerase